MGVWQDRPVACPGPSDKTGVLSYVRFLSPASVPSGSYTRTSSAMPPGSACVAQPKQGPKARKAISMRFSALSVIRIVARAVLFGVWSLYAS